MERTSRSDYTKLNATLLRVIQEGLVTVSTVAIKAVLADAGANHIVQTKGAKSALCSCERCNE